MARNLSITRTRLIYTTIAVSLLTLSAGSLKKVTAQADNLTPGMLFGPLSVSDGQHIELCASYLSEGSIKAVVHFRNLTTGEVTTGQTVTVNSGGGACVSYQGKGNVVGMARGDGAASDWVSPSNALISSMSVMDDVYLPSIAGFKSTTRTTVLGVAKIWVKGL